MDFYSGVTPARFGDRLSGVLDIAPRQTDQPLTGELGLSLLYAHGLAAGRTSGHGVNWLASVRKSTVHAVLNLRDSRLGEPEFLDAIARVSLPLGDAGELVAGLLSLDDTLSGALSGGTELASANYRDNSVWLRGQYRLDSGASLHAALLHSDRHTQRTGGIAQPGRVVASLLDDREFDNFAARFDFALPPREHWSLLLGGEWGDHNGNYEFARELEVDSRLAAAFGRAPQVTEAFATSVGGASAAFYVSLALRPANRWRVDLGLRTDHQNYDTVGSAWQTSPRIGLEYSWRPFTTVRLSYGHSAQAERPDELQAADGVGTLHAAQRARQAVLSVEHRFNADASLRAEAYSKRVSQVLPYYENLFDPFALLPELEPDRVIVAPLRARIYGVELSGRWQPHRDWNGWLSYSWSEATDVFPAFEAPRSWQQQNAVMLGGSWQHANWQVSANVGWHSGWRRTLVLPLPTVTGPRNAANWEDYFSLDLKAAWTRSLARGSLKAYAEITNSTNRNNPCCVRYGYVDEPTGATLRPIRSRSLPLFPMIGVIWQLP